LAYNFEAVLANIEKQRNGQPPEPTPPVTAPNSTALDTLGLSIQRAATANPQDEAKRRKLAGELKIPQAILPPTPDAESQAFLKNARAQEIMQRYPALANWAQNPDNAAVAGKDLVSLGDIEKTASSLPKIAQFGKNLAGSAAAAFPSANAAIWSFVQAAGAILSTNVTKPLSDRIGSPDVGEMLRTTALDMRKRASTIAGDLAPDTAGMGTVERGINSGVQSAATSLMMLPLSVATGSPTPMLAGLSAITAGQSLGEATDKGLPLNEALIHATKQGVIEYATELFPVGNLLKNLTMKTGLVRTATEFMVREGIGEQAATVLQDLDKWATLNPDKPFSEYLAERPEAALETLIATAVGGSIQVGGAKMVAKGLETLQRSTTVDLGRAQRAEENHGIIQGLGEQAAKHPLRERDPSAFHDFMATMTEDGNLSDVYVDGKVLGDVLNQSGINMLELGKKMPEVAQQLAEAQKTNGEVRISLADYATYVAGTDVEKGIIDHLRASPDGMTYTEAQQFYQSQKEDLSKQAATLMSDASTTEEYKADVQQVHDTILEGMNKAGRFTPAVNAAYAVPFREFYAVQAAKMGMLPSELYKQMPLNFAGVGRGVEFSQASETGTVYRGEYSGNKNGSYYTNDKEFAREFTQSGQDKEIKTATIAKADIYEPQELPFAGDTEAIDAAIVEAKVEGKRAVRVSEGEGQPPSLFVFDKKALIRSFGTGRTFNQASTVATKTAYENRISELFRGAKPNAKGVKVLDRADVLDMLGYGGEPLYLVESKVSDGMYNHKLNAAHWKKIPQWLDSPAMVLDSDTVPGRLVFIAPEVLKDGTPIVVIVEPSADKSGAKVNLLVNSYEKSHMPLKKWVDDGLLRYYDKGKSFALTERSGLYKAGLTGARSGLQLPGMTQARSRSGKILRETDLVKYRQDNPFNLQQENRAGYNPDTFTISLLKGADLSSTLHEGGHFYLEALAEMAGRPDAPQQIKDDFRKTLDWFGITGNENLQPGVRGADLGQSKKITHDPTVYWHGSPSGDLRGGSTGLHLGTKLAATQALESRIGVPATGTWDGTREYGKTLLAGRKTLKRINAERGYDAFTGQNASPPEEDYYPTPGMLKYADGTETPMDVKPSIKPFRVNTEMSNSKSSPHEDFKANGYMRAQKKKGNAKKGYYYTNVGEDDGSISIVVPDGTHVTPADGILNQGGDPGTPGDLPPGRTPEEVWRSMSLDQKRPYHEQWAQSFERYMLEGKAPTTEMQPIFARFRAWMLNVYKSLENFLKNNPLAGKLNDEVRGIFDRLIAAEESIKATESVRAYAPLFENSEAAGVTPKRFQEYLDLGEAATQQAIDDLSARSLRDMKWLSNAKEKAIKELQKEAKAKRKVVEEQVKTEVMSEPVNQARTFLKTGEMTDPATGDQIKAEAGFKLDKEAVAALFPKGGTVTLDSAKLRGMTAEDGLSPELAAQMFGFPSGEALILELVNGESAKEKIEAMTDQRMLEQYGELSSEEDIERAAEAAIHNEARARFLATGLAMLSKSPIPANQLSKAAKQAAEATIASRKVRDLRPAQYERAETKANKEAIALAPKDPQGAVQAQRAALLNNRLAKVSADAVKEVEKILRYVGKFQSEGTRKALDLEYLEQIDDLLRPFDFRKGQSLKQIDKNQSLADWIDAQEAQGFEPAIDAALMDQAKLKSYKNMTMEELRGLIDSVKQIEHLGRLKNKLLLAKDEREFKAVVAEGIDSIEKNANRTVEERGTPTDAIGIASKWWRQMTADHRKFASIMREMDGGKDNGFMFNHFLKFMNQAGDNETQMKAEATDKLAALFKKIKKDPVPGNIYAKKRVVPGTNLSMTHEQRIMFAMNWGNAGNRQRLLDGGITGTRALSIGQAEAILDTLTQEEWDFVQGVWDFIGEYKEQVAALERRLTGIEPTWIDPAPVKTKYGTYKGGYFPVKYDTELSSRSESLEAATDLRMGMKGAFNSAATRSGFTKMRADQVVNRPILLSYNAISQHVSEVTHRLAWQEWLVDSNRLLKALDNPIRAHYGAEILRTLRDTVVDIAAGDAPAKNGTETAINRLRVGSTVVGMGWRVTTALLQPSGLAQSWARVGGRHMARGVYQFSKSPITSSEFVNSKSKMMVDRGKTMQREINEVLNTIRAGEKVSAFKASYFSLIGKMQRMVDIPTWLGAYDKATEELKLQNASTKEERTAIEEQAAALADQAVLDSQSGGQLKDLAKVQRGSPLQKIFTNFYSYFSATYNLNVEAVRRTNFKSPSQVALLATDMVLLNSVPVLFSVALKELLKGECGDDLECLGKKLGHEQLNFLLGQMILLREAGVAIDTAAGGQGFGYQGPAGLRFFSDLYKLGQQTNQGEADMAFFKAANQVSGAILHYPAGQINATMEGIIAIEEGKVEGMGILPALISGPPKK
jgi:hypothetical protein